MDSRAQFEEWLRNTPNGSLWDVWQASRASIEVELPAELDATNYGFSAFNDALDICETELRKHGISIKGGSS